MEHFFLYAQIQQVNARFVNWHGKCSNPIANGTNHHLKVAR